MASSDAKGEQDWLFDSIMQVFKSPAWDAEIMTFIDENCICFDNEEENKFIYTDIFVQYQEKVDSLLMTHLESLSITADQFAAACETARSSRDVNMQVFDQLMAMDDFLTFKKLMVKRNMELELEAVQELQQAAVPIVAPADDEEAEKMFQQALKESAELSEAEAQAVLAEERERMAREAERNAKLAAEKIKADFGAGTDAELRKAIDRNLLEMELLHKQEEMEQLELEHAIAMSLAAEEDRLARAQEAQAEAERFAAACEDKSDLPGLITPSDEEEYDEEEEEDQEEEEHTVPAAEPVQAKLVPAEAKPVTIAPSTPVAAKAEMPQSKLGPPAASSAAAVEEQPTAAEDKASAAVVAATAAAITSTAEITTAAASSVALVKAEAPDQASTPATTAQPREEKLIARTPEPQAQAAAPAPAQTPAEAPVVVAAAAPEPSAAAKDEAPLVEKKKRRKKKKDKTAVAAGAATGGLAPLNAPLPKLNPKQPLPSIADLQRDMSKRRREAEEAFRRNQDLLREQKVKEKELATAAGVTEEDAQRRAAYLREQRDRLVAKKKAEREAKLKMANEAAAPSRPAPAAAAVAAAEGKDDAPAAAPTADEAEERRMMMRIALARRMKQDLLETEEERLSKLQAEQYSELDRKLRLVDKLRDENRQKEMELQRAIRQQQELRFRNLQHSVAVDMAEH